MKSKYRECDIESKSEKCLGGWKEVYWSAFSPVGYEITSGFGDGTVREMYQCMKDTVDEFIDSCNSDEFLWEER